MKRLLSGVIFGLFILSGICGLIYEVVWSKYLALFIGSLGYSHVMVLATYLGGMALGAFFWGKFSDNTKSPLRLFGLMEIGVGLYCLLFPTIMNITGELYFKLASSVYQESSQFGNISIKLFLSMMMILPPTFLMGGTLPVLMRFLNRDIHKTGKEIAKLYYINCLGAVLGSGLAGYVLIPKFGLDRTILMAASINILVGSIPVILSLFAKTKLIFSNNLNSSKFEKYIETQPGIIRLVLGVAFFSGVSALLYEITWIRLLSNILGSTTYSFSLMLMGFISGIMLGSLLVSLIIQKIKDPLRFLAYCQLAASISMLVTLPFYERLPYYLYRVASLFPNTSENFPKFLGLEFLFCFLLMIIPTTVSGMSLPIITRMVANNITGIGRSVGNTYALNSLGSVVGVLLTGLFLLPLFGVKNTFEIGLILNAMMGLLLIFKTISSKKLVWSYCLVFVLTIVGYQIFLPQWDKNHFVSGVFRNLHQKNIGSFAEFENTQKTGQEILWYKDGLNASVAVRKSNYADTSQLTLVINGKADASTLGDLPTQILLAQIPILLTKNDGDALVVGLGSGITCGSALKHPIKSLDVVEISSEVLESNFYFEKDNYYFKYDPRTKIYIDDAFSFLKLKDKTYQYIISEPSNPWIAGIGNLYSIEFFELCKKRLHKNGVVAQWFHTYDINNDIFRLVLGTISRVFPYVTIWKISNADVIILASPSPMKLNLSNLVQNMASPKISEHLKKIHIPDAATLLSLQTVSSRNNPFSFEPTQVNSIKFPILEYLAPMSLYTHEYVTVLDSVDERFNLQDFNLWYSDLVKFQNPTFENYLNIANYRHSDQIGDFAIAYTSLKRAMSIHPNHTEVIKLLNKIISYMGIQNREFLKSQIEELKSMVEIYPQDLSYATNLLMALVEYYRIENSVVNPQKMEDVVALLKKCIELTQGSEERFYIYLASILTGAGRNLEAAHTYFEILQAKRKGKFPQSEFPEAELHFRIGESLYNADSIAHAESFFKNAISQNHQVKNSRWFMHKINLKKQGIR